MLMAAPEKRPKVHLPFGGLAGLGFIGLIGIIGIIVFIGFRV